MHGRRKWQTLVAASKIFRFAPQKTRMFHSNIPMEHTPDPQPPVYCLKLLSYLYFGVPGVCCRVLLKFSWMFGKQTTSSYLWIFLWDALSTCWLVTTRNDSLKYDYVFLYASAFSFTWMNCRSFKLSDVYTLYIYINL